LLSQCRWSNDAPAKAGAHHRAGNTLSSAEPAKPRRLKTLSGPPTHRPRGPCDGWIPPRSHNLLIHICPSTTHPRRSGDRGPRVKTSSCRVSASGMPPPGFRRNLRFRLSPSAELRSAGGGGGERDRTDDLLLAKQALSQLSYTPFPEVGDQRSEVKKEPACFP
jgi:hypothetical protein